MVSDNTPAGQHHGAPKHGDALLAGLLRCRRCGRKLTVRYTGASHHIPRYSCWRGYLDSGEPRCVAFGGLRVDDAIEAEVLAALEPGAVAAAVEAEAQARRWCVNRTVNVIRQLVLSHRQLGCPAPITLGAEGTGGPV